MAPFTEGTGGSTARQADTGLLPITAVSDGTSLARLSSRRERCSPAQGMNMKI